MRWLPVTCLLASACGDAVPLSPPEVEQLTRRFSCGDVVFVAATDHRTAFLAARTPHLVAQTLAAGVTTTTMFTLPDARLQLELVSGRTLNEPCDDALGPEEIHAVYLPASGTATIVIEPGDGDPEWEEGLGTLELRDVSFEWEDDVIELESFVIGPTEVGRLPG